MKNNDVKEIAEEVYNDLRADRQEKLSTTEKETREIVESALNHIARRHKNGDFKTSELVGYFEKKSEKELQTA